MTASITDAEAIVMEVLWTSAPRTTEEILAAVTTTQAWQLGTVKSLLNRLLKKNAVKAEQEGRRYLYTPLISRDDYLSSESAGLLDRLFGGRVAPLVAHFSAHRPLSKRDIAELRKLLDRLE
ncbi:BlaI/MecI/CopY family transcriptional regulator [Luteibacter aegosomaticola]|uniref:BlaI/MecI/CopY family transcriptional regulator n=1 Tax=Luteibacter aegosomaticola TaxID=2911538 RepID=UPI001FFB1A08|nr:BlaI/MecI/CopY family transcriptional regulator [Luteibacter aegosomaticola]UPG88577.1 BlaI/MecI/CopY family transcriptional regulator [Luteibacter aegosomaticola]